MLDAPNLFSTILLLITESSNTDFRAHHRSAPETLAIAVPEVGGQDDYLFPNCVKHEWRATTPNNRSATLLDDLVKFGFRFCTFISRAAAPTPQAACA
jgi:hypothetical protein